MKKSLTTLMALIALSTFTPAMGAECLVKSVKGLDGFSESLKPKFEEILTRKGYTVIDDGLLYESYDVPVSDLKVRDQLLEENNFLAVSNSGEISNDPNAMCSKWISGVITCHFSFQLYKVIEGQNVIELANIKSDLREKPSLFKKESKIVMKFMTDLLDRADKEIPECK